VRWWQKEKPTIKFVNVLPGVAEIMPIIPAKELKRPWVDNALRDFAEARKNPDWNKARFQHISKCPGMFTLHRHGWVLRAWQDITITTKASDPNNFSWLCASDQDGVGSHGNTKWIDYYDEWKPNTLRNLVKIHTGWSVSIPDGYYLFEIPLPHYEEYRFTTIEGFWPSDTGPVELNPTLYWHVLDGATLIKAGTPLAQYVLVPAHTADMVVEAEKPIPIFDMRRRLLGSRFVTSYSEIKKFFGGGVN
jgi:hypothetical protein